MRAAMVRRNARVGFAGLVAALLLASFALVPPMASVRAAGTTYTVTTTADNVNDANCAMASCTLRQAVNASNANDPGAGNANRIIFSVRGTITLLAGSGGTLTISKNVMIDTTMGNRTVTVSGNNAVQLFSVNSCVTLLLVGLTLTGGNATNFGGAIFNLGTLTVTGSTFANNSAPGGSGGAIENNSTLTLVVAVVANNTAGGTSPDISGAVTTDGGGNVVGNTDGSSGLTAPSDKLGTGAAPLNPLLGSLGNYGGTVQTLPLLPGSPAIDRLACPVGLTTDARGVARPQGPLCDAGSYEAHPFTLGTLTGNTQQQAVNFTFTPPLGLTVTGTMGDPVAGGQVTFTITPGSGGASAIFATVAGCTNTSATVAVCTIAANGTVATPRLTANGALGTFTVTASAAGAANAVFTLTIAAPNATPAPAPTGVPSGMTPATAPPTHPAGVGSGAGTPMPLPQPARH